MGIDFGWVANEQRESIWIGDKSLWKETDVQDVDGAGNPKFDAEGKPVTVRKKVCNAPVSAQEAWREDGDASHLRPYCLGGQPQIIRFRTLTLSETWLAESLKVDASNFLDGWARSALMYFRIGVDFEGKESQADGGTGDKNPIYEKVKNVRMLREEFVKGLEQKNPGMVAFYGRLIMEASMLTDAEKKASSPRSTPTPSAAEESTAATTDPSPKKGDA